MKTYNAMNSLINDYSSIENVLGEFLSINITEDDFGQPFYEAVFSKETLSQWCNLKQMEDENKHSFLRKIHSQKIPLMFTNVFIWGVGIIVPIY